MNVSPPSEANTSSFPGGNARPRRALSDARLFWLTVGITAVLFLLSIAVLQRARVKSYRSSSILPAQLVPVNENTFISAQLKPDDILALERRGIQTIVDIRPDGEDAGQPSSAQLAKIAEGHKIHFHYIPVPHGTIPEEAVQQLQEVLAEPVGPAVLYCRTGRRAVRLFALVEASRHDGPDTKAILKMVQHAGFSAIDLKEDIARRISQRSDTQHEGN